MSTAVPGESAIAAVQRRTVWVLSLGQILGGLAFGATLSLGAILAAEVSGDQSLSGLAAAAVTAGTAATAVPLAALARRRGRRIALTTGMIVALGGVGLVVAAAYLRAFPLLLAGFVLIGAGQAVNLQSRFAAADLATSGSRGRDLSIVVWATTVGAVLGPNLAAPGEALGAFAHLPPLTGAYLFTLVGQLLVIALYLVALRPDPLLLAQRLVADRESSGAALAGPDRPATARYAIFAIAAAHGVMVAVMAMTPVHLLHHGAALSVIGVTLSLHIAGMYAASPIFGILADRVGRVATILVGQALLAAALVLAWAAADSPAMITVALVLLGLGWSASTVAGSALLTEASAEALRTRRQGVGDFTMSIVAAVGAVAAGGVLGWVGYGGLALSALVAVVAVVGFAGVARRRPG